MGAKVDTTGIRHRESGFVEIYFVEWKATEIGMTDCGCNAVFAPSRQQHTNGLDLPQYLTARQDVSITLGSAHGREGTLSFSPNTAQIDPLKERCLIKQ